MLEEDIADVYEDYLTNNAGDIGLVEKLLRLIKVEEGDVGDVKLEDYEREHLIRMILNVDWTGKLDEGFEDTRRDLVDGDNYRCEGQ